MPRADGAYLQAGGFEPGREAAQAEALWGAALNEATRVRPPFDTGWFATQLNCPVAAGSPIREASRSQDWGEAPDILGFLGRQDELKTLKRWVLDDGARLIALLGMGGIGKTN